MFRHPVEQPQHPKASDLLFLCQLAQLTVPGQQRPCVSFRESKGETVRQRQRSPHAEKAEGRCDRIAIQFLDTKPKPDEFRPAVFPELALVQQVGNGELERKTESGFDKAPAIKVNQDGGVGYQDLHGA